MEEETYFSSAKLADKNFSEKRFFSPLIPLMLKNYTKKNVCVLPFIST